jgi:hypothetical protein
MARPRAQSTNELPKEPHSISLKGEFDHCPPLCMVYTPVPWLGRRMLTSGVHDTVLRLALTYPPFPLLLIPCSLSRPSLSYQFPLPLGHGQAIPVKASLSYPSQDSDDKFILSPNVRMSFILRKIWLMLTGESLLCHLPLDLHMSERHSLARCVRIMNSPMATTRKSLAQLRSRRKCKHRHRPLLLN